jgi:tetratricopeptide (TPR) repeat protein
MSLRLKSFACFIAFTLLALPIGELFGQDVATQVDTAQDTTAQDQNAQDQNAQDQNAQDQNAQDQNAQDQNAGQAKLDEATGLKLQAESPADLGKVIELCEEALKAGLNEGDARLARQLLAASAFQRAQLFVQLLPRIAGNPRQLQKVRRDAMDDLEKAVENNPQLAEAFTLMAKLETLPGGDRTNAMESLNKAITILKDKPIDLSEAFILRAQLQEDVKKKIADLRSAIESDSTNSDAWQALIALQVATGSFQEAVEDAEKLLEKDENNEFAVLAAVQSLLGLQKNDEAIALLGKRIEKDPSNGTFYRARAGAYRAKTFGEEVTDKAKKEANQSALENLNKAVEINGRDYEALVERGILYYELGEIEKANRDISDSLLIEPNSVRGVMARSMVAAQEGRFGEAIADMEMLVRADPTNVAWIEQLATYYQMDDRPRLAIKLYDQLIAADDENWRALRLRGDAKLSISEHPQAVADYKLAIDILEKNRAVSEDERSTDIDYSGLLNNLAWVLATSPKEELRDGEKSVELGLKACEATDYKEAHILSTLAAGYAETGDFENARKWATKAVEVGEQEGNEQLEQLKKELESYKQDKPWREEQSTEENNKPLIAPSETIDT